MFIGKWLNANIYLNIYLKMQLKELLDSLD